MLRVLTRFKIIHQKFKMFHFLGIKHMALESPISFAFCRHTGDMHIASQIVLI